MQQSDGVGAGVRNNECKDVVGKRREHNGVALRGVPAHCWLLLLLLLLLLLRLRLILR